jgi:hypothetical protein
MGKRNCGNGGNCLGGVQKLAEVWLRRGREESYSRTCPRGEEKHMLRLDLGGIIRDSASTQFSKRLLLNKPGLGPTVREQFRLTS